MNYVHKGIILENGTLDPGLPFVDSSEMAIQPDDDGFHIVDFGVGDFEWWYFDIMDTVSDYFLKIVIHIGTNPLKTRIFPQLVISINTPEGHNSFQEVYNVADIKADAEKCNISIRNAVKVWAEFLNPPEYHIQIDVPHFQCNLRFINELEGWKPLGSEIPFHIRKKKGVFSWTVPTPKAKVEGDIIYKEQNISLSGAIGYHDHNYIKVDKKNPLHLDELVTKWYWGKFYAGRFTILFADTFCRPNRIHSLLVAEGDKILHSSNNLLDCSILKTSYDTSLKVDYPASLMIKSKDENFPLQAEFQSDKLLDSKDLLEGVDPVLKWLIKKIVAKPAYHGIQAKVRLEVMDECLQGLGNFESMVFRGRHTPKSNPDPIR
jgi:hypothetical protein